MTNKESTIPPSAEAEETAAGTQTAETTQTPEIPDAGDTALVEELEEKAKAAEDKHLRLLAEFDNYRKRTDKEKCETFSNAAAKCVSDFLPVIDNFERALQSACTDENYKNGIQLIFNQLNEVLKKMGVTEIEALGKPFDPNFHNAVKQMPAEGFEPNTVCEVMQKGYIMCDKVIRYAFVAVAE